MVPAPPQVARQRPQPFLGGSNKAIEGPRFAYHRPNLDCRLDQHPHFILAKDPGRDGLDHQDSLQNAAIDQGNAEEGLVCVFAGFTEVLEARMVLHLLHRDRTHSLRDQPGEAFMDSHAQGANALRTKPNRRCQHQVGAVRFKQISGADIGLKALGNQGDYVHQGLGRLATFSGQIGDFFQGQDVIFILRGSGLAHVLNDLVVGIQVQDV